jgi:hypothetical protein
MKRIISVATCIVLTCCSAEKPIETKIYDAANDVDLIVEHRVGPALSQSEDKLYLVRDDERKLIFEGYGGSKLSLLSLKRGILFIVYCGGSIRSAESFLAKEKLVEGVSVVKVQPIITSGIQINGKSICDE